MRLYLLPVSTRRTLLYAHRSNVAATDKQTLMDKVQVKAAKIWSGWEEKEKGWQKTMANYGNYALKRIPYEEWGLKSVPPLSTRRQAEEIEGVNSVEVVYPKTLIPTANVAKVLHKLGTEREGLHRQRLIWCCIGMPISAPFALVPVIPNIPFFYLAYRAWSHWRALKGGQHIQFLLEKNLLTLTPSPILDEVYAKQEQPLPSSAEPTTQGEVDQHENIHPHGKAIPNPEGETMLLCQANGKKMTHALDLPQLEVELERAIWQVEEAIKKQSVEEAQKFDAAAPAEKGEREEQRPGEKPPR